MNANPDSPCSDLSESHFSAPSYINSLSVMRETGILSIRLRPQVVKTMESVNNFYRVRDTGSDHMNKKIPLAPK